MGGDIKVSSMVGIGKHFSREDPALGG